MSVGEKIQLYRKNKGMPQEELGQKMLVSRQTVSLWEMDKTLPTVDNLLRLKEIFSVSIDDILSENKPIETETETETINPSRETYRFQYEKKELVSIYKQASAPLKKRAIVYILECLAALVLLAVLGVTNTAIVGILIGISLAGAVGHIKGYFSYRNAWKKNENKLLNSTYVYEVFDCYFVMTISRNNEITTTHKFYFSEIEKIHFLSHHLLLQIAGQGYILRKDALRSDSALFSFCYHAPNKVENKMPTNRWKPISILLFVLSIATIFGGLICVSLVSGNTLAMTDSMWVFYLFLPIPIASIVFGFWKKFKKNVIVGFIMASLLFTYGSVTFIFSSIYTHDDGPIMNVEQMLNIDIPTHRRIDTQDWTQGTQSIPRGYVYYTSDIYFDDDAVEAFENNLLSDAKWMTKIPNDMIGITSYFCDVQTSDYYIIYNKDTGDFNRLPADSGSYVFINVLYNSKTNTMKLVEYQIEYTK